MQEFDPIALFGLYLNRNFLDPESCANLLVEVNSSFAAPALVYIEGTDGDVHQNVRKTTGLHPSNETISEMSNRLSQQKPFLEDHFGVSLTNCETPQFLRYETGDFFVRHQDGNTKQLPFDHLRIRKISIVVFLNNSFSGGALRFHDGEMTFDLLSEIGLLVAFRADVFHEVMPVTSGQRFTMITWFR